MDMTAINNTENIPADSDSTTAPETFRHWTAGLFVSALFGTLSGLGGLTLGFLTFIGLILPSTSLYTTSTLLIGASFVLFGLAAHCIDKADAADKAIRLEYCRQHGLKD